MKLNSCQTRYSAVGLFQTKGGPKRYDVRGSGFIASSGRGLLGHHYQEGAWALVAKQLVWEFERCGRIQWLKTEDRLEKKW